MIPASEPIRVRPFGLGQVAQTRCRARLGGTGASRRADANASHGLGLRRWRTCADCTGHAARRSADGRTGGVLAGVARSRVGAHLEGIRRPESTYTETSQIEHQPNARRRRPAGDAEGDASAVRCEDDASGTPRVLRREWHLCTELSLQASRDLQRGLARVHHRPGNVCRAGLHDGPVATIVVPVARFRQAEARARGEDDGGGAAANDCAGRQ